MPSRSYTVKTDSHMSESYFEKNKTLNVFQLNILNNLVFMHKIKSQTVPKLFQKFLKPTHKYPTNFSTSNCRIPLFKLSKSKYRILIRVPILWKNISSNSKKMQEVIVFNNSMRKKLRELQNETLYFSVKLLENLKHK